MSAEQNRAALNTAVAALNKGDVDGYLALLYDSSIRHHGLGPEPFDEASNRTFYEGWWSAFPDTQVAIDDTIAEGDKLAMRFHMTGQHHGEFMGLAPTGRSFLVNAQTLMLFRDSRVIERWTTGDLLGLFIQLGAIQAPG